MKASKLLKEIKESIKQYDIHYLEDIVEDKNINNVSKQVANYNIKNYYEILYFDIKNEDDFEISDTIINNMKCEIELFFNESPATEEVFKNFIIHVCLYLSLIVKKPLHPIKMDFKDNKTVFMKENDGKRIYYCDVKEEFRKNSDEFYICKFCVCKGISS